MTIIISPKCLKYSPNLTPKPLKHLDHDISNYLAIKNRENVPLLKYIVSRERHTSRKKSHGLKIVLHLGTHVIPCGTW